MDTKQVGRVFKIESNDDIPYGTGLCVINSYGDIVVIVGIRGEWFYVESDAEFYKITGNEQFVAYYMLTDEDLKGSIIEFWDNITSDEREFISTLIDEYKANHPTSL